MRYAVIVVALVVAFAGGLVAAQLQPPAGDWRWLRFNLAGADLPEGVRVYGLQNVHTGGCFVVVRDLGRDARPLAVAKADPDDCLSTIP